MSNRSVIAAPRRRRPRRWPAAGRSTRRARWLGGVEGAGARHRGARRAAQLGGQLEPVGSLRGAHEQRAEGAGGGGHRHRPSRRTGADLHGQAGPGQIGPQHLQLAGGEGDHLTEPGRRADSPQAVDGLWHRGRGGEGAHRDDPDGGFGQDGEPDPQAGLRHAEPGDVDVRSPSGQGVGDGQRHQRDVEGEPGGHRPPVDEGDDGDGDGDAGVGGEDPGRRRRGDRHDDEVDDEPDHLGFGRQPGEGTAQAVVGPLLAMRRAHARVTSGSGARSARPAGVRVARTRSGRRCSTVARIAAVSAASAMAMTRWAPPMAVATVRAGTTSVPPMAKAAAASAGGGERSDAGRHAAQQRLPAGRSGQRPREAEQVPGDQGRHHAVVDHVEADGGDPTVGQQQGLHDDDRRHADDRHLGPDEQRRQPGADQVGRGAQAHRDDEQLGDEEVGGDDGRQRGDPLPEGHVGPADGHAGARHGDAGGRGGRGKVDPAVRDVHGGSCECGPMTSVAGGASRVWPTSESVVDTIVSPGRVAACTSIAGLSPPRPASRS